MEIRATLSLPPLPPASLFIHRGHLPVGPRQRGTGGTALKDHQSIDSFRIQSHRRATWSTRPPNAWLTSARASARSQGIARVCSLSRARRPGARPPGLASWAEVSFSGERLPTCTKPASHATRFRVCFPTCAVRRGVKGLRWAP